MKLDIRDRIAVVRMWQGEDYLECLKDACIRLPGTGVAVVSSIGQFTRVSLGFYRGKGDYHPKLIEGPMELLNVSGIVSKEGGGALPHLHAVVGDAEKRTFGGHLLDATVGLTAETVLYTMDVPLTRIRNEVTGTMDLELSS